MEQHMIYLWDKCKIDNSQKECKIIKIKDDIKEVKNKINKAVEIIDNYEKNKSNFNNCLIL